MVSFGPELTGISLSVLGWVLSVISCALSRWRDTTLTLLVDLPEVLQSSNGLAIIAVFVGAVALLITMMGARCTAWIETERLGARVLGSSGGLFITAALIQWAPFLWTPLVTSGERKMKNWVALYLCAVSSGLLIVGGAVLCTMCTLYKDTQKRIDETKRYNTNPQTCVIYSATPSSTAQSSHHINN